MGKIVRQTGVSIKLNLQISSIFDIWGLNLSEEIYTENLSPNIQTLSQLVKESFIKDQLQRYRIYQTRFFNLNKVTSLGEGKL